MNWITLTALNEIYRTGSTRKRSTLSEDPYVQFLLRNTKELKEQAKEITGDNRFKEHYEREFLVNYTQYDYFLIKHGFKRPQTRFEENDIKILMAIEAGMNNGELIEIRNQIIEAEESVRGVSLMFFKHDKYLEGKPSLLEAIKLLLNISQLSNEKDQQYKYILECKEPKCIILCENIDFLRRPTVPRKCQIELWYAGGRNVNKLEYSNPRGLPIYYSCDWDFDGLDIFRLVKEKIEDIELLSPIGIPRDIVKSEHNSLWPSRENPELLSGLNPNLYSDEQKKLIKRLIQENLWIVEESNNLIEMIKKQ